MIKDIKDEKVWADYIFIKIACDAMKKRITLYRNSVVEIDQFDSEYGNYEGYPIRILFTGEF